MKRLFAFLLLALAPLLGHAQQRSFNQAELEALLAPVALYPDAVLGQVLAAAGRPHEVAEAAAWSRAHPHLSGEDAVRAAQYHGWHPAVSSLAAYPDLLARMGENPHWVRDLGEVYALLEPHVLDTVQQLRRRAEASGYLRSDTERQVYHDAGRIVVQPVQPHVVYVPYYNPLVVFGTWGWPAHRPVFWRPWHARPVHVHWHAWHHHHHHRHRHLHLHAPGQRHAPAQRHPRSEARNGPPSRAAQQQAADTVRFLERQRAANQPPPALREPQHDRSHREQRRERREAREQRRERRG